MRWTGFALIGIAFLVQACKSPPSPINPTPAIASKEVISAAFVPTAIPPTSTSRSTSEPTEVPVRILLDQLQASLLDELSITTTPDTKNERPFGGINYVNLRKIPNEENYWLVYSVGSRSYDPLQNHFIAIYSNEDGSWIEIARETLENSDHINKNSIGLVDIDLDHAFIEVKSTAGAHGGCYDLFDFSGSDLEHLISNCASSPEAGEMLDLDGDGIEEVALNWSEDYVFCYACGVRIPRYQLWRWDGEQGVEVTLSNIEGGESEELIQLNNEVVMLANAELWKEAQVKIERAVELNNGDNQTIHWNAVLINFIAGAREEAVQSSGFPLLSSVFFGDYESVMDILRVYRPYELFSNSSPLINGSAAEGSEEVLLDWINTFTDKAIKEKPNLAAAYYIKAWATYLVNPTAPSVIKNLEKAASLDKNEELFSESFHFLRTGEGGE